MGTANQLQAASSLSSVKVAGVGLPVVEDIKAGDLPKPLSADYRPCTDASVESDAFQDRLH